MGNFWHLRSSLRKFDFLEKPLVTCFTDTYSHLPTSVLSVVVKKLITTIKTLMSNGICGSKEDLMEVTNGMQGEGKNFERSTELHK